MSSFLDQLTQNALSASAPKQEENDFLTELSQNALGTAPVNAPGIVSDIKRGSGQVISALGSTLQDIGAEETGQSIEKYGEGITRRNPSQINTVGEALSSPLTTVREAVGEVIPQVGVSAALGMGGRVVGGAIGGLVGGPVGLAVGQNVGAAIGAFGGNLIQEYGGIRSEQRESGQNDIARAIAAGSGAAILDTALGAERVANKVLGHGTSFLAREAGEKMLPHIAKQAGRGLLEEAGTEFLQTGIERVGAFKDLTSEEALNEMGLSAIKGGIGGGVVRGGMASIAGERTGAGSLLSDTNAAKVGGTTEESGLTQAININPGAGLSTKDVVNQAIGIEEQTKAQAAAEHKARMEDLKAAFDEPTGIRVTDPNTGLERELTAFELYQQQAGGQAAEVADNAKKTQEMNQARADVFNKYDGVTANRSAGGTSYSFLNKVYHTEQDLNAALDKVVMLEQAKTEPQRQLEAAFVKVNKVLGGKPLTPSSILSATKLWNQLPTVQDMVEALDLQIEHDIPKVKNQNSLAKLEQLHVLRDELAGVPEDKRVPTVDLLPKEEAKLVKQEAKSEPATAATPNQQTQGVSDERLQLQQQGNTGLRTVSEQGGATQTGTGTVGNVRPTSVQSEQPGSVGAGPSSVQVGAVPESGVSTGASTTISGPVATNANIETSGQVNGQAQLQETGKTRTSNVLGQTVEGSGDVAETSQDRAERIVGEVVNSIVEAVVKRTGTMKAENLKKLKEFIYYDFFQVQTKDKEGISTRDLAYMYSEKDENGNVIPGKAITEDQIKGWRKTAGKFFDENRGVIQAQIYAAIDKHGMTFQQLIADLQAVRNNVENDVTILEEGQKLAEASTKDDEQAQKGKLKEAPAANDLELTELGNEDESALDERDLHGENSGMSISTGRVQSSIQEQNKPEETINARMKRKLEEYNKAVSEGDEEAEARLITEIDELQKEAKKVDSKRVAKAEAIAEEKAPKKTKEKKDAVQKQSTDEGNVRKPTKRRKKVGEGNAKSESTTGESKAEGKSEGKSEGTNEAESENALTVAQQEESAWNKLPVPIQYEQLSPQAKADWAAAFKAGKTNLAAANKVYEENIENIQKQIADDSKTIDGKDLITEVGEEKQRLLLADQTSKLSDAQNERLEKHYGVKKDSEEFFQKLREDVVNYVNKGAEAVAGAIRDIIRQIANGVMAVAIIFNPQFMGQQVKVAIPTNTTELVQAKVPTAIDSKMSKAAKKAFSTILPAIQKEMKERNKYFTIVDKPTSTMFVFNPDGTLLDSRIVVLGKAFGDFYTGQTDFVKNRITPGGHFIATAEKGSATYDGKTVYTIGNEAEGWNVVFMHPVYLKESDAQARRDALATGKNTRLSHGCVNGPTDFMASLDSNKMDGSHVFIVPDDQAKVDDFISNKISNADLTRVTITPVTKKSTSPWATVASAPVIFGKEEKAQFSKKNGGTGEQWDSDGLTEALKTLFSSNRSFDSLVTVVSKFSELPRFVQNAVKDLGGEKAQAFVYGKHVYMLASNIELGQELGVFLHEVGVHLGMENLLGSDNYYKLGMQIEKWVKAKDNTLESKIAKKAKERVAEAKVKDEDHMDELIAYFVEEAVAHGVRPQALGKPSGLTSWFRTLIAALKVALRKIGLDKFDKLTAGNLVDLAFGAAKLEISGAYHGSAAEFLKFMTKHIGTGEGAVAYGWGLYMAERFGVALDYMRTDVNRKSGRDSNNATTATYKGMNRDTLQMALFDARAEGDVEKYREYNVVRTIVDNESRLHGKDSKVTQSTIDKYIKDEETALQGLDLDVEEWDEATMSFKAQPLSTSAKAEAEKRIKQSIAIAKKLDPADFGAPDTAKAGMLYRTLPMVNEGKLLDLDERLSKQPEILELLQKNMPEELRADLEEYSNLDLEDMTGRELQEDLMVLEDKGISDMFFQLPDNVIDTIKQGQFMSKQIVSEYLRMMGVEGNTYLDRSSRSMQTDVPLSRLPALQAKADEIAKSIAPSGDNKPVKIRGAYLHISDKEVAIIRTSAGDFALNRWLTAKERQDVVENIKSELAREFRNIVLFSNNAVNRVARYTNADKNKVQFSFASKSQRQQALSKAQDFIDTLPKSLRGPVRGIHNVLFNTKEALLSVMITEDMEDLAAKYLPSVKDYRAVEWERTGIVTQYTDRLDSNMLAAQALDEKTREAVNRIIEDSTISEEWAYDPKITGAKYDAKSDLAKRFNALPSAAQAVVKEVFATGTSMLQAKKDAINAQINSLPLEDQKALRKDWSSILTLNKTSPYAPLKRFGDFVVTAKSKEYMDAEAAGDKKAMEKLQGDAKHYVVEFADTIGEALEMKRVLDKAGVYQEVKEPFKKSAYKEQLFSGTDLYKGFSKLKRAIEGQRGVESNAVLDRLSQMVNEMYLMSLAESSARKSEMQRKGIAGINRAMGETFARDMLRAAFTQGAADARFIAGIKTNDKAMDAMIAMQKEAAKDPAKGNPYLNEIMAREAQSLQIRERSMLDTANRLTADWFLTFSPSFYFQQATQSYVLSLPWLAGRFGEGKSFAKMTAAYKEIAPLLKGMDVREHLDFNKLPADVRDMLQILIARGRINIGTDVELAGYRSESANPVSGAYNNVTNKLRGVLNRIEAVNRSAAAIAAYRLEMERKGGTKESAIKAADDVVRETHGLYDGSNTPRLFNKNALTRNLFQFRRFQIIQATMLFKMMANSVKKGDTPEAVQERAIARKQLMFMVGHSLALAGMKGIPFYGMLSLIYGLSKAAFGDDKDPEDFEEWLRKHGGVLLARGIPAWMGVDVSNKVGMGNVFSVLPYTDVDLTSKKGYEKALVAAAGPFLGGLMPKMIDSVDMVAKGDYYKGLENALPNGVNNVMKSYRFATEGVTLRNGDTVMTPAELGFADIMSQLVGMPSTTLTERQYAQGVVSRTDQYFSQEAKDIKHAYTSAAKDKDSAGMAKAREEWNKLQDARVKQGYKRQPLSDLLLAPQAQLKRERSVIGGVETNKGNKAAVRRLMES